MSPRRKLGEILLEQGLIDEIQLRSAMGHQKNWGGRLGSALVELGFITEDQIARVLEGQLRQRCLPGDKLTPEPDALATMSMQDALRFMVLPLKLNGNELLMAMTNPLDLAIADEIGFKLGKKIKGVMAVESAIKRAIKKYYAGGRTGRDYRVDVRPAATTDSGPEVIHYGKDSAASVVENARAETKRVEPSPDLISKAVAYLLIEKGVIRREELIEKMRSIKEKGQG